MIIIILTIILLYAVDTLLISIAFFALKDKFKWNLSPKKCFFILIALFIFNDSFVIPMLLTLDAEIKIGNESIIKAFDLSPTVPLIEIFDIGILEFVLWCLQAFFAGLIGERLFTKKEIIL